jgi:hypothetical protein
MMYLNYTQIPSQRSTQRLLYVRKADAHLVFRIGRDLESRLGTVIPENADNGLALDMLESAKVDCEAAISSEVSSSLKLRLTIEKGLRGCQLTKGATGKSRNQGLREYRAVNGYFRRRHGGAERAFRERGGSRREEGLLACSDRASDQAFSRAMIAPLLATRGSEQQNPV